MAIPSTPPALTPCQLSALEALREAIRGKATSLVELRGPPGRGHGISTVLRTLADSDSALFLGVSVALGEEFPEKKIYEEADKALEQGRTVILDDADIAARPSRLRASRNAGEQFRGSGNYAFEDAPEPVRLLKSLQDLASARGGTVIFSTVEEGHERHMQRPHIVRLALPKAEDFAALAKNLGQASPEVEALGLPSFDFEPILSKLPVRPTLSEARRVLTEAMSKLSAKEEGLEATPKSLEEALRSALAHTTAEGAVRTDEVEKIDLDSLPGMGKISKALETHVLFPILHPQIAARQQLVPKRGVLLYGPPGTGKTTVGRALAHRLKGRFFMIRELLLYKEIFEVFAEAKACAPSVVFFDDIDVLLGGWNGLTEGARGHDLTRFLLSQMDGLCTSEDAQVVVVMAAADAKFLPPAILRSGRIELWLKTEKPKTRERKAMLQHYVNKAALHESDTVKHLLREPLNLDRITTMCEDFVPADLRRLVSDARNLSAAEGAEKSGGDYLEEAAMDLRSMKEDVEGLIGRMYT
mmetsp:Transcript_49263/g.104824  ORF Transcript_49263/g.104824 Transcript_49263/m.104824 type:complete len:528 (+) Transcript_49263:135-1718(+)|eukprot:CAMPEP_0206477512 /NCGR_PEP_ID=MMETSP0324_2-20121206/35428_1 /ASSEMBLY_ACC=CAM_ASM_000836 /TAXON_ID=2866 /ORGANISM="Crypthecodinium cohnii, Strain Seligo" /LENGTH=527 /DNA_ID=CAMNT_0053953493 /DNA_START=131 /DNA_END=1714 /DNA_ORIENTATION=-